MYTIYVQEKCQIFQTHRPFEKTHTKKLSHKQKASEKEQKYNTYKNKSLKTMQSHSDSFQIPKNMQRVVEAKCNRLLSKCLKVSQIFAMIHKRRRL